MNIKSPCRDQFQEHNIKSVLFHPSFEVSYDTTHDVALIYLEEAANLNVTNTICLPFSKDVQAKLPKEFEVLGWGRTEKKKRSNELRRATIPLFSFDKCKESYGNKANENEHICAGDVFNEIDTCDGKCFLQNNVHKLRNHLLFVIYGQHLKEQH